MVLHELAFYVCTACLGLETGLNFIIGNDIMYIMMQKTLEKAESFDEKH